MEVQSVVVSYRGQLAHYAVVTDNFGVYEARLLKYEGSGRTPPGILLLVKGEEHWVSACKNQRFADSLGRAIERRVRNTDPNTP